MSPRGKERRLFGKYDLIAKLASGGMGEIYLARLVGVAGFEKLVVIKRVLPHLVGSEKFTIMLLDEARIAARLSHPNICQVHELGEVDGEYYIAMEYMEGVALLELFRRVAKQGGKSDVRVVAGIIAQACEGLHAAHELLDRNGQPTNLVHRDISPSNIFITAAGAVKILDFGIAKTPDKQAQTRTGAIKGKWAYMSPEQVLGKTLDRRSDIFSLGIVLFEALTLRRLYRRKSEYLTCRAITEFDAPPALRYRSDLPRPLAAVIAKALSRNTDERFATAREMSKALTAALGSLGGPASLSEVAELVDEEFRDELAERRAFVQNITADAPPGAGDPERPSLPVLPHSPADTSIASSPDLELTIEDPLADNAAGDAFDSSVPTATSQHTPGYVARASGLALPLTSPPTVTSEKWTYAPERSSTASQPDANRPSSEHLGEPFFEPPGEGRAESSVERVPEPAQAGVERAASYAGDAPRARRASPMLWIVAVLVIAGAGGVGAYFAFRPPAAQTPSVVVYASDIDTEDAGTPADGATTMVGVDGGATPDGGATQVAHTSSRKRRTSSRRSKRDRYAKAMRRSRKPLGACLDKHAVDVQGTPNLRVEVDIATSGKVSSLRVLPRAVAATALGACIRNVIRAVEFGKHDDPVTATFPLSIKRTRSR